MAAFFYWCQCMLKRQQVPAPAVYLDTSDVVSPILWLAGNLCPCKQKHRGSEWHHCPKMAAWTYLINDITKYNLSLCARDKSCDSQQVYRWDWICQLFFILVSKQELSIVIDKDLNLNYVTDNKCAFWDSFEVVVFLNYLIKNLSKCVVPLLTIYIFWIIFLCM